MENTNLDAKLLDTAINTMVRNRTLLFTINLIAAILLAVFFLENFSIDERQRKTYLTAYDDYCDKSKQIIKEAIKNKTIDDILGSLKEVEKQSYDGCSDLNLIQNLIVEKVPYLYVEKDKNENYLDENGRILNKEEKEYRERINEDKRNFKKDISEQLYRMRRIRNDIKNSRLETASVAPIGFGLSIPRNDLVTVCGFILTMLYLWLMFSYNQHARILAKIRLLFPEKKRETSGEVQASINDLVELNFLFRTSDRKSAARHLVRILYWLAPITMLVMTLNDFFSTFTINTQELLRDFNLGSTASKFAITFCLMLIGFHIHKLDKNSNRELRSLLNLCGLRLGMSRLRISKMFPSINIGTENNITINVPGIKGWLLRKSNRNSLYLTDVEEIKLVFSKTKITGIRHLTLIKLRLNDEGDFDRIKKIEVTYSSRIKWLTVEEFARFLSGYFSLPFNFWNLYSNNEGVMAYGDFSLKINSEKNQITLEDTKHLNLDDQEEGLKMRFRP